MPTVVILLSDKRSGSTMFQEELCRHPDVQTIPFSPHRYLETHWWLMAAVLLGRPPRMFAEGRRYAGYGSRSNARALMVELLSKCVGSIDPPKDDYELVFAGWEALCNQYACPVFIEKSPQILPHWSALSLMLEWIEQTEHEVRIVGMSRNPHGAMYSAAKLFGTEPSERQFGWLELHVNLLAIEQILPAEKYLRVRYEDLVSGSVSAGFTRVCQFIGIEPSLDVGKGIKSASLEKWRNDPGYTLTLDRAVFQMAQILGYSDGELANDGKTKSTETLIRDDQLRLWFNRMRDRVIAPGILRLKNRSRSGQ